MAENLEANDVMNLVLRKTFFVEKGDAPLYWRAALTREKDASRRPPS